MKVGGRNSGWGRERNRVLKGWGAGKEIGVERFDYLKISL